MENSPQICTCTASDARRIYHIINEAAKVYDGVIPADCYHQPYMPLEELDREMKRMVFYGWKEDRELIGVMGLERIKDVTLIRHAYILPGWQRKGIGSKILYRCRELVNTPRLLVGTWADNSRAISFYQKHGFRLVSDKNKLLETYWDIPRRQIETSVVLSTDNLKSRG